MPHPHLTPGGVWQCLKTFFVFATGREVYWHLINRGQVCCKHPVMHRTDPTAKNYLAQKSIMLRLRSLELEEVREPRENKSIASPIS